MVKLILIYKLVMGNATSSLATDFDNYQACQVAATEIRKELGSRVLFLNCYRK